MSLKQKALKGVIWSAIQSWGSHVITFSVFLLLARLLDPKDFGLVAMAGVFIAFMKVFLDQGFASAIIQRQEVEAEHLDTAFWTSVGISTVLVVLCFALAGLVAGFYEQPQLIPVIRLLSLSFLFKALNSVQVAILSRKMAFKSLAIRSLVAMLTGSSVGLGMAAFGFGVWSLVGQQLVMGVVEVVVLWTVSDWKPGFQISTKHLKELLSFGINVVGLNGLNFLNRYSDNLLIGKFLGEEALGYYTVAYRLLTVMTELLIKTVTQVALPTFSKLQHDPERMRGAFYKATQLTSLVAFPGFMGAAALAPEIVQGLFGSQWTPSIPVMKILAFIGMLQAVSYFNGSVIMAMGKPSWKLAINSFNTVINVIGFFFAVPWGILAVATTYVIRGYLFSPIDLWAVNKLIRLDFTTYLSQYLAPSYGSLIMIIALLGAKEVLHDSMDVQLLLPIYILLGAAVYAVAILVMAPKLFQQVLSLATTAIPSKLGKKR